jgi:CDGSH-type Zn-finger protein
MALCRCGHSGNKPFATVRATIDFDGTLKN